MFVLQGTNGPSLVMIMSLVAKETRTQETTSGVGTVAQSVPALFTALIYCGELLMAIAAMLAKKRLKFAMHCSVELTNHHTLCLQVLLTWIIPTHTYVRR